MRLRLIAWTFALCLGSAAPAGAAELPIDVIDFDFMPATQKVDVGDTVVWTVTEGDHSTTSVRGQAESWNSNVRAAGSAPFRHVFKRPGRFRYFCIPHEPFMKGVIQVGEDRVARTVKAFRTKTSGRSATVTFTLNEAARTSYTLSGPSRRAVRPRRLKAGRHSFKLKGLKRGRYSGTLTLTDDFAKTVRPKPKSRFSIG